MKQDLSEKTMMKRYKEEIEILKEKLEETHMMLEQERKGTGGTNNLSVMTDNERDMYEQKLRESQMV